jgi:hypothetical protein
MTTYVLLSNHQYNIRTSPDYHHPFSETIEEDIVDAEITEDAP